MDFQNIPLKALDKKVFLIKIYLKTMDKMDLFSKPYLKKSTR